MAVDSLALVASRTLGRTEARAQITERRVRGADPAGALGGPRARLAIRAAVRDALGSVALELVRTCVLIVAGAGAKSVAAASTRTALMVR